VGVVVFVLNFANAPSSDDSKSQVGICDNARF
jgi:hypothetical protein